MFNEMKKAINNLVFDYKYDYDTDRMVRDGVSTTFVTFIGGIITILSLAIVAC